MSCAQGKPLENRHGKFLLLLLLLPPFYLSFPFTLLFCRPWRTARWYESGRDGRWETSGGSSSSFRLFLVVLIYSKKTGRPVSPQCLFPRSVCGSDGQLQVHSLPSDNKHNVLLVSSRVFFFVLLFADSFILSFGGFSSFWPEYIRHASTIWPNSTTRGAISIQRHFELCFSYSFLCPAAELYLEKHLARGPPMQQD